MNTKEIDTFLILHNIRSAENVGAIFRTADAVGVSKIFLTGYTPLPVDQFNRPQNKIAKTALGAEKTIEWEHYKTATQLINHLHKEGVSVVAVEQDERAVDYKKIKITKATAFIFGNEVLGVSKKLLDKCDAIASIPMKGKKESLNVSVSAGVFLFRVLDV